MWVTGPLPRHSTNQGKRFNKYIKRFHLQLLSALITLPQRALGTRLRAEMAHLPRPGSPTHRDIPAASGRCCFICAGLTGAERSRSRSWGSFTSTFISVTILSCRCSCRLQFGTFRLRFICYRGYLPIIPGVVIVSMATAEVAAAAVPPFDHLIASTRKWRCCTTEKGVTLIHGPLSLRRRLQKKIIRLQKVYFDVRSTMTHNFFTGRNVGNVHSLTNWELYLRSSDKIMSPGNDAM